MADRRPSPTLLQDTLTGLPNRYEFERRLARAMAGQASNHSRHCLACLNLDRFSNIVHQAGAEAGDTLLQQLSTLLSTRLRTRDTLARLDDHAFGLLLEHCPLDRARELLWSLTKAVANHRLIWMDREYQTPASAGLVAMLTGADSVAQLLSHAEVACHIAMEHLGGGVYVYQDDPASPDAPQPARHQPPQIRVQPLLPLHEQGEAWQRLLIDTSLAKQNRASAVRQAHWPLASYLAQFKTNDRPLLIPLSVTALTDPRVLAELAALPVAPEDLLVELGWHELLDDTHGARQALRECAHHGLGVLAHGFSGGLMAFQQLAHWPLRGVILDTRPCIQSLRQDAHHPLLAGLVAALHNLGLSVIVDGLDDTRTLTAARDLAVDLGAGEAIGASRILSVDPPPV